MTLASHIKNLSLIFQARSDSDTGGSGSFTAEVTESSASLGRALFGVLSLPVELYVPPDIIGGTCPRIRGQEHEVVWHAAAEACDSERIHTVWQSAGNRTWYFAIRSDSLASHPNSWCPLAALLATVQKKEALPACYTYYEEEMAMIVVLTSDELNVFRGTAPVIKAKTERILKELSLASAITLDPYQVEQLKPVPWFSASLFEDRARRGLSAFSALAALAVISISFLVWVLASLATLSAHSDLSEAIRMTQIKSLQLIQEADTARFSPVRRQLGALLAVNDALLDLNGYLTIYEVKEGVIRWRALVPPSATGERIVAIGGKNIGPSDDGIVIGNDAEIEYEAAHKGGK